VPVRTAIQTCSHGHAQEPDGGSLLYLPGNVGHATMTSARGPLQPDARDRSQWYGAVRYGIGLQLRREMEPEEHVPQRFRDLVRALEQAERDRKG
jgi:hypothetical protein